MPVRPTLIFIPTYNERDNVERLGEELLALPLDADILFIDDNSPDQTGQLLDAMAARTDRLKVIHRAGKSGIGSAHQAGIAYAYQQGYTTLVTMDSDFTHLPADIPKLLEALRGHDVSVGSRYLQAKSLEDWNLMRKTITRLGGFATRRLLKIKCDATGAFRAYDLTRVKSDLFKLANSSGYSFFFESMYIMQKNNLDIVEVPIVLPKRTYGTSKMQVRDVFRSLDQLFSLAITEKMSPAQFRLSDRPIVADPSLVDPQDWDSYWTRGKHSLFYHVIAGIYRNSFIKANLNREMRRNFPPGSALLHAGCGGGEVDANLCAEMSITGLDISLRALYLYSCNNPQAAGIMHGSIFALPYAAETFDGVYNLGVMEHFSPEDVGKILAEFHRVLKKDGKLVLFWPHRRATSVFVLGLVHWLLHAVFKRNQIQLHPPEIFHITSRSHTKSILAAGGFQLTGYRFGPADLFVQARIAATKKENP